MTDHATTTVTRSGSSRGFFSPMARFSPTGDGWLHALKFAAMIQTADADVNEGWRPSWK